MPNWPNVVDRVGQFLGGPSSQLPSQIDSVIPGHAGPLPASADYGTHAVTTQAPGKELPGLATAPAPPAGNPAAQNIKSLYGGTYALSPADWADAKAKLASVYPQITKYATAGQAPEVLQQSAASYLAQQAYQKYGNWADAAIVLAGGTPGNSSQKVLGKGNMQVFSTQVANQVNNQLNAIMNQLSTPAAPVITRQAPTPAADALAAAQSADPAAYAAHNMSLAEGELSSMLYGTPSLEAMSTSNVQGDIAQVAASNSMAT